MNNTLPYNPIINAIENTSFNRVSMIARSDKTLSFSYSADNQRNKTVYTETGVPKKTTYYIGNYEKEVTPSGTKEYDYIHTPEGLSAIVVKENSQQTLYYVHTDHLGSIRTVSKADKSIQTRYFYDAWGVQTLTTGTSITNRGYSGHEYLPEFGLINMNARMYDPILGRFLEADPYVADGTFSQDFNRYSYARNNPLVYTDPDGEFITWSVSNKGFSIGFNLTPIGIPLGAGINIGWKHGGSAGVYGEVGYRVGGTGLGSGATISQSLDYGFKNNSWSTTTSAGAYASFMCFNVGANGSYSYNLTNNQGSWGWGVSGGINLLGNERGGIGLNVGYGSDGWTFGVGGYYNPGVKTDIVDRGLAYVQQEGDYNCGPTCGESASRGGVKQKGLRDAFGGNPNANGIEDGPFWQEWSKQTGRKVQPLTIRNKEALFTIPQKYDVSISTNNHAVMLNKSVRQSTKIFGIPITRHTFYVMDPSPYNGGAYIPAPSSMLINRNTFLLFPH